MLVIKQFGPITYAIGTLQEILAATNIVAGSRALPNDVAGCTLEMGTDGLWTGASVGTLTQVQADALVASGVLAKVKVGTSATVNGRQVAWGGVGWVRASDIGPGSPSAPFASTAELLAAYPSTALPPRAGFEAYVKDANGLPMRWVWLGAPYTNWIPAEAYSFVLVPQVTLIADDRFIGSDGTTVVGFAGDKRTDYIPVEPNTRYIYRGSFSDIRGYAQYDSVKSFVQGASAQSFFPGMSHPNRRVTALVILTASTTRFLRFSVEANAASYTLEKILTLDNNVSAVKDYSYDLPDYVFGIDNDSSAGFYAREYVQSAPVEGLVGSIVPVLVNNERALRIQNQAKNTTVKSTTSVPVSLSGTGYMTKSGSVSLVKTKASVAKNTVIRYLAIGDSITANQKPGLNGAYVGGWCYPSCAKEFALMDNIDAGDDLMRLVLLGTTNLKTTTFDYAGSARSLRGLSEGRGSWTTCNYLRHAMHTTTTASGSGSSFENRAAWDAMGLGRKIPIDSAYDEGAAYETYANTVAQRELIRATPWGKYHWDYSTALWDVAKAINRNGIMNGAASYTGSGADKTRLDMYMAYVLDNPDNPFYDKIKAKTNSYAFSLVTYLARYKTLADDGVTRLVVGSTAGSKIDAGNLANIDVCTPTHVTLELGENERWWYPATAQNAVDDNMAIANLIVAEFPTMKVGFVNPRHCGVMYPERWPESIVGGFDPNGSNAFKYQMNGLLKAALGSLASQVSSYFLPCYYLQSPLSRQDGRLDVDLGTGASVIVGQTDPNHPGVQAYRGMGYQILAWIYYTLAL